MKQVCEYCGSFFMAKPRGRPASFCSSKCRSLFWKHRNRIKANAHNAVYRARKKGLLNKQLFCELCGGIMPTDAHHPDYKKPKKIQWLCHKCNLKQRSLKSA